jgi:Ca2+-binding EF-hand superfamily protein
VGGQTDTIKYGWADRNGDESGSNHADATAGTWNELTTALEEEYGAASSQRSPIAYLRSLTIANGNMSPKRVLSSLVGKMGDKTPESVKRRVSRVGQGMKDGVVRVTTKLSLLSKKGSMSKMAGRRAQFRDEPDIELVLPAHRFSDFLANIGCSMEVVDDKVMGQISQSLVCRDEDASIGPYMRFGDFIEWYRHHGVTFLFNRFDSDGNGVLTIEELPELLKCIGLEVNADQVADIQKLLDCDRSGHITLAELQQWWTVFDAQQAFKIHDLSHDGAIDHRELRLLARELGVEMSFEEARMAVAALDVDHDSTLSYEEFLPWWMAFLVKSKQRVKRQLALSSDRVTQLKLRSHALSDVQHMEEMMRGILEEEVKKANNFDPNIADILERVQKTTSVQYDLRTDAEKAKGMALAKNRMDLALAGARVRAQEQTIDEQILQQSHHKETGSEQSRRIQAITAGAKASAKAGTDVRKVDGARGASFTGNDTRANGAHDGAQTSTQEGGGTSLRQRGDNQEGGNELHAATVMPNSSSAVPMSEPSRSRRLPGPDLVVGEMGEKIDWGRMLAKLKADDDQEAVTSTATSQVAKKWTSYTNSKAVPLTRRNTTGALSVASLVRHAGAR